MGYFNPVFRYGVERFAADAANAGVDGLIIVDVPPEEDSELRIHANTAGIDYIRLATPTSDEARLPTLMEEATGFVYYVSPSIKNGQFIFRVLFNIIYDKKVVKAIFIWRDSIWYFQIISFSNRNNKP